MSNQEKYIYIPDYKKHVIEKPNGVVAEIRIIKSKNEKLKG